MKNIRSIYFCFLSSSQFNFSNFNNKKYDETVILANIATSLDLKRKLQKEASGILFEETPAIAIAEVPSYLYIKNKYKLKGNFINGNLDIINIFLKTD
jgi:ABC-type oligopeptide transport system substrate-binding subunit